jgi:hypothetical protein
MYRWSVDIFGLSLSVEKLFNIFHLAGESPLGAKFWGFLNPVAKFGETDSLNFSYDAELFSN